MPPYGFIRETNFIWRECLKCLRTLKQPASLPILHDSDLKPYVVFLSPPTLQMYRQQRLKYGEAIKVGIDKNKINDKKT